MRTLFGKKALVLILIIFIVLEAVLIMKKDSNDTLLSDIFSNQSIVKISENPTTYICKKNSAEKDFENFMGENGWSYLEEEQLGAGLIFEKDGEKQMYILNYKKDYAVWSENR